MSWVVIDREKCNACGICAVRCARCFNLDKKKVTVQADENCCNLCGHCVSLCPTGAIRHSRLDERNFESAGAAVLFEPDDFMRFIRQRRSHRHFKKKGVPKRVIQRLIEAARYAPTGSNVQGVEIIVLQDEQRKKKLSDLTVQFFDEAGRMAAEKIRMLPSDDSTPARLQLERTARYREFLLKAQAAGYDPIFHRAPLVLLFHTLLETSTPKDNCVIASTTLGLFARTLGLEFTYIGLLEIAARAYPPLAAGLGLPEGHQVQSVLILGYPRLNYLRLVDRNPIQVSWQ